MAKYNGHKNYNHWNVSLWINNDEGLYNMARDFVNDKRKSFSKGTSTREYAAMRMLNWLQATDMEKTPDGVRYTVSSIRAAMVGM